MVLGGLVDHLEQKSESGIPLLKDIPLLGNLFKSHSNTSIANELLLMVTPHVIRTDEDLENMSRSLRGAMPALNKEINRRSQAFDSLFVRPDTSMAADTIPGGASQGARR